MKLFYFSLSFLFIFVNLPLLVLAEAPNYDEPVINMSGYQLIADEDRADYEYEQFCPNITFRRYFEYEKCLEKCDECVIDNELCWSCQNQQVGEEKMSFWSSVKNLFSNLFTPKKQLPPGGGSSSDQEEEEVPGIVKRLVNKIKEIFVGKNDKSLETVAVEKDNMKKAKETLTETAKYALGESDESAEEIEKKLKQAMFEAPDMGMLIKLLEYAYLFCSEKHKGDSDSEDVCRENFLIAMRARGDQIKEELFAKIDPKNPNGETYCQIIQLRALLMAGTSAYDEGVWFSTENIKKIMVGLQEKAQEWLRVAVVKVGLAEMDQWYYFASANMSPIPYGGGKMTGGGLYQGDNPLTVVRYRARRLALQHMAEMDICNPDLKKLKEFQDLLSKQPGCVKLLNNEKVCKNIENGNLEAAYADLYEQDRYNKTNQQLENQAPKPIDCNKQQTTTLSDKVESGERESMKKAETFLDDEKILTEEPATDTSSEIGIDDEIENVENVSDEIEDAEYLFEPDNTETDAWIETEDRSEQEPEPESESVEPVKSCDVVMYEDSIIGWDFYLQNCSVGYSQAYDLFMDCGSPPPLVIAEQTETEIMCYETAGGFVDYSLVIPCYPAPIPPTDVAECVGMRLVE